MASASKRSSPIPSHPPPTPAGGMASPSVDPPAASGQPLQGQTETNGPISPPGAPEEKTSSLSDDDQLLWRAAAMELGRASYFRHRSQPLAFQEAEGRVGE